MVYRPSRIKLKDALVGDKINVTRHDKYQNVEVSISGMVTAIRPFRVSDNIMKLTLGKGRIELFPMDTEVKLLSSVLRDEGIAMVVGGSPTLNVSYVRVGGCLYRVTYDWMTDKAARTSVDFIPNDEQLLQSVGKFDSNRESKIRISMDVPLTRSEAVS